MREILFRGKRADTKEWVEGYHFMGFTGIPHILVLHDHILRMTEFYEVIPETVGQFTGLFDKNGTMIFEGDIVSYEDISRFEDGVGDVLFDLFYGAWFVFVNDYEENSLADVAHNCEIIGNIHDQKEEV